MGKTSLKNNSPKINHEFLLKHLPPSTQLLLPRCRFFAKLLLAKKIGKRGQKMFTHQKIKTKLENWLVLYLEIVDRNSRII
jgi:hypothetical protein